MADKRTILFQGGTISPSTPAILTPTTGDTILAANANRGFLLLQNLGTNPLFVRFGAAASSSVFHVILAAGTGNDDGKGGTLSMEAGSIWTGIVSVGGTSPRCIISEM